MNIVIIVLYVYILVINVIHYLKEAILHVSYSFSCVSKVFYDSSIHLYYYNHNLLFLCATKTEICSSYDSYDAF